LNYRASPGADGKRFIGQTNQRNEGASVNEFFLVRYVGVNVQTGNAEWLDVNGNVTTTQRIAKYALVLQILILLVV
jgi:hypothetical protein